MQVNDDVTSQQREDEALMVDEPTDEALEPRSTRPRSSHSPVAALPPTPAAAGRSKRYRIEEEEEEVEEEAEGEAAEEEESEEEEEGISEGSLSHIALCYITDAFC